MILGIMQPYFFPHLGYFDLINYADKWIVFDRIKYIRHGWINRNRIHHPTSGWQYIIVPLQKHASDADICDVKINREIGWKTKILGQIQHYKKTAARFAETSELVEECLNIDEQSISRLNLAILRRVCSHLNIELSYEYFSEMNLELGPVNEPGDWALSISRALNAAKYVNPPGGEELFDRSHFAEHGIDLEIREIPPMPYETPGYEYIPRLSIIDLLMWKSPAEIKQYLDQGARAKGKLKEQGREKEH